MRKERDKIKEIFLSSIQVYKAKMKTLRENNVI